MKFFTKHAFILALVALTGCASSPDDLRSDASVKRLIVVDMPYQLALKKIVDHHQRCDVGPLLPIGQVINDVQHYPDLKLANIVRGAQGIGRQIHLVIDIEATDDGGSKVILWSKFPIDRLHKRYRSVLSGAEGC